MGYHILKMIFLPSKGSSWVRELPLYETWPWAAANRTSLAVGNRPTVRAETSDTNCPKFPTKIATFCFSNFLRLKLWSNCPNISLLSSKINSLKPLLCQILISWLKGSIHVQFISPFLLCVFYILTLNTAKSYRTMGLYFWNLFAGVINNVQ